MITTFDVETSFQVTEEGKLDPSSKNPDNFLISMGLNDEYIFFKHREYHGTPNRKVVQDMLDKTTLLVGHNIKFDLIWLWESGFKYTGRVYDTMVGEYLLNRGMKTSLKLKDCCMRRSVTQKSDLMDGFIKNKTSFENVPIKMLEEYGRFDIKSTRSLFDAQIKQFKNPKNKQLVKTVKMMCEFLVVLAKMENNGIFIDNQALLQVEKDFQEEHDQLRVQLDEIIYEKMGDTAINPSSPEQLSWLIYGAKVTDKKKWAVQFNLGIDKITKKPKKRFPYSKLELKKICQMYLCPIYKTKAEQCSSCSGKGYVQKIKVNGQPFKNLSKCIDCSAKGFVYVNTKERAGFGVTADSYMDAAEGGFKTDKNTLLKIGMKGNQELKDFVEKISRYNALDTYLKTFVEGIKKHKTQSNYLFPNFMQCITTTGRLSSRDPNFQNQPRGGTFPIRKVIRSRFNNGKIMEIDFAQLEFRVAVFLSKDRQGLQDIKDGVDVHQFTADTIGCDRQNAKAHTFKPLYGGMSGTADEKRYYTAFLKKYPDIKVWHDKLQDQAIRHKVVTLPTGRQYAFPNAERMPWGGSSFSTQIKNYPVQGFATADIVPLACILSQKLLEDNGTKSILINTVHDSIVADVFPGEEKIVADCLKNGCLGVVDKMREMYGIDFDVPLDVEIKAGSNWLDTSVFV
jgi:DNA polymerase I-like protein with 3'-5' exonuclease and polymerase domains